jgi:hypothetical protein
LKAYWLPSAFWNNSAPSLTMPVPCSTPPGSLVSRADRTEDIGDRRGAVIGDGLDDERGAKLTGSTPRR